MGELYFWEKIYKTCIEWTGIFIIISASLLQNSPYDLKDGSDAAWRSLSQPSACYPYDPAMAAYPYGNA